MMKQPQGRRQATFRGKPFYLCGIKKKAEACNERGEPNVLSGLSPAGQGRVIAL
ncbi:MAG: hypothetical protein K0Q59_3968 [Paenibacillus sp.]|nr:hypothetical protein [Paenibacillus sp.]